MRIVRFRQGLRLSGSNDSLSFLIRIRGTRFRIHSLPCGGINPITLLALSYPDLRSSPGDQRFRAGRWPTLVLGLELRDPVNDCRLLVIQVVFLGIDNHHRVTNCSSKLVFGSTTDGHVSDEVGYHTHLNLFGSRTHLRHSRIRRECALWIEAFQTVQRWRSLYLLVVVWDDEDCVSVEVRTRQPLCHFAVNSDSIASVPESLFGWGVVIVDSELWNLEDATMRVSYECNTLTISIVRSIDLSFLDRVDRQNNMRPLTGKRCRFEMNAG